jgi:predicted PurR-regulated permease PerM
MTGWDILNEIMKNLPPIAAMLFLLVTGIIFAIGFFRHGVNFIKYGFKQTVLDSSLEKRFDSLEAKFDARISQIEAKFDERFSQIDARFSQIDARIMAIETNHFGHLKNFLSELTSILLDKNIINNTEKARLDNQLRDM